MRNKIIAEIKPEDLMDYFGIQEARGKYLCPFHGDTNPSMTIKGDLIRCWVCQDKAINVIDFTMMHESIGFSDAINLLCEIGNIDNTQKKTEKTVHYKKAIESINSSIKFAKNALLFDFNDIGSIKKDIERLERKKRDLLSMMLRDDRYIEREMEKERELIDKSDTKFKRKGCAEARE